MKLYVKRTPKTHPLGITTRRDNQIVEYFSAEGYSTYQPTKVAALKDVEMPDVMSIAPFYNQVLAVWSEENVDNPYYSQAGVPDKEIPDNWITFSDFLRKTPKISEQMYAELKYNLKKGDLTPKLKTESELAKMSRTHDKTFMEGLKRRFQESNIFDDESGNSPLEDHVWIKHILMCCKHPTKQKRFAPDLETAIKLDTDYYIHDSKKEAEVTLRKRDSFLKAAAKLEVLNKENSDVRRMISTMTRWYYNMSKPGVSEITLDKNADDESIKQWLIDFLFPETPAPDKEFRFSVFLEQAGRYDNSQTREALSVEYLIVNCINSRILVRGSGDQYKYEVDGLWQTLGNYAFLKSLNKKENKELLNELTTRLKNS